VKLTAQKILFCHSAWSTNDLNEGTTTGFRFKHCSPTGDGLAKREFKGLIKEYLSKRLKGAKIRLCEQQLAAIIISTFWRHTSGLAFNTSVYEWSDQASKFRQKHE
jgi:hypothetical protein